jgi:hypothetical protein
MWHDTKGTDRCKERSFASCSQTGYQRCLGVRLPNEMLYFSQSWCVANRNAGPGAAPIASTSPLQLTHGNANAFIQATQKLVFCKLEASKLARQGNGIAIRNGCFGGMTRNESLTLFPLFKKPLLRFALRCCVSATSDNGARYSRRLTRADHPSRTFFRAY